MHILCLHSCVNGGVRACAELLRENKRLLDKAIRELDRERNSLQLQEKKLVDEMKKNAKQGQMVRVAMGARIELGARDTGARAQPA